MLRSAYLTASQKSLNVSAAFVYIPTHLCKVRNFECFETSPGSLEYFYRSSAISSIVVVKHGHWQYLYITKSQLQPYLLLVTTGLWWFIQFYDWQHADFLHWQCGYLCVPRWQSTQTHNTRHIPER